MEAARAGAELSKIYTEDQHFNSGDMTSPINPINQMLESGINFLRETFILWDGDDRLVICNEQFREVNAAVAELLHPGTTFEELLRASVEGGCYPDAIGREELWIEERIDRHRNPRGPFEVRRQGDLWFLVDEQRMPDGGLVTIATNVTDQKRAAAAAKSAETRFRQHAAATSDWLWEIDANRRYTYISETMKEKVGQAPDQYIGTTVEDSIKDFYDRADWQPFFDAFEAQEPIHDLTVKRRDPNGREQWIRTGGVPFYAEDGTFLGYRGSTSDVSKYVESQKQLENLTAAINQKSEHVVLYDADDRLVFCNDIYREINKDIAEKIVPGTAFEDIVRAGLEKGFVPEAIGREEEWLAERLARHRDPAGPVEQGRQNGAWHLIQEQRLADGGIVSIVSDISERKRTEDALRDSERQLRLVADAMPAVIVYIDAEQRFQFVNKTAEIWYDRPAADFVGATISEVVSVKATPALQERFSAALNGHTQVYEARQTYPDGQVRDVSGTYIPDFDEKGEVVGVYGLILDIGDRKRSEDALRDREQQLRLMTDALPVLITYCDAQQRYQFINRVAEEWLGQRAPDIVGKKISEILGAATYASVKSEITKALSGEVQNFTTRLQYPDGKSRDLELTYVPHVISDSEVVGFFSLGIDVTDRLALEERFRQSQKMEAVGQLTGGIAHEINNILQVIVINLALLESDLPDDEETRQNLQSIGRNVNRGAELTDRLLSFSRRQPLAPQPLIPANVLMEMQALLRQTLGETIQVDIVLDKDVWMAEADLGQLENALLNLALNARDAMPGGGAITLSATNTYFDETANSQNHDAEYGDYVVFSVSDHGVGMSEEDTARAFEPFFTTKDISKGTGLGLSMVYGFAQQSGGFAEIDSAKGSGTTVRLYLPRIAETKTAEAQEQVSSEPTSPTDGGVILVVEDDVGILASLAKHLGNLNYRVIEARNGEAALSAVSDGQNIDLLFTDVVMPGGMNGYELSRRLRQLRPGLKLRYATGYSDDVSTEA